MLNNVSDTEILGGGWEFPLLLVVLAITVAIQGGGAFALRKLPVIDALILAALKA